MKNTLTLDYIYSQRKFYDMILDIDIMKISKKNLKMLQKISKESDPFSDLSRDQQYNGWINSLISIIEDHLPRNFTMPEFDIFVDENNKLHLVSLNNVQKGLTDSNKSQ